MEKQTNARHAAIVLTAAAMTALFAGCAAPKELVVVPTDLRMHITPGNPYENAIELGEVTDSTSLPGNDYAKIHAAWVQISLKESLQSVGFLAKGSSPQYRVNANIIGASIPKSETARVVIEFTLVETSINAETYRNKVTGEYTATFNDGLTGEVRNLYARFNAVRLAVEEFFNEIIEAGIVR